MAQTVTNASYKGDHKRANSGATFQKKEIQVIELLQADQEKTFTKVLPSLVSFLLTTLQLFVKRRQSNE